MQITLHHFAAVALVLGSVFGVTGISSISARAESAKGIPKAPPASAPPTFHASEDGVYDPVADPKAVVILDKARFTVLTPQMIRMEWAADGKFEDHASFVFLNRRLPVPRYSKNLTNNGHQLTIKTDALTLTYTETGAGYFTHDNLSLSLVVDGKRVTWRPGTIDLQNLKGTTRTLDGALGDKTKEPIGNGFISRSGWAVEDDSTRPLTSVPWAPAPLSPGRGRP